MLADATFDVISVAMAQPKVATKTIAQWGRNDKVVSWDPNHLDNPDTAEALDKANPPPRSSTKDQGIFKWTVNQSKSAGDDFASTKSFLNI